MVSVSIWRTTQWCCLILPGAWRNMKKMFVWTHMSLRVHGARLPWRNNTYFGVPPTSLVLKCSCAHCAKILPPDTIVPPLTVFGGNPGVCNACREDSRPLSSSIRADWSTSGVGLGWRRRCRRYNGMIWYVLYVNTYTYIVDIQLV